MPTKALPVIINYPSSTEFSTKAKQESLAAQDEGYVKNLHLNQKKEKECILTCDGAGERPSNGGDA